MELHWHQNSAVERRIKPLNSYMEELNEAPSEMKTIITSNSLVRLSEHQHSSFLTLCHLPSDTFAMIFPKGIDQMLQY